MLAVSAGGAASGQEPTPPPAQGAAPQPAAGAPARTDRPQAQEPSRPAFRAGIDLVSLNVTVTDQQGHYVTELPRESFLVFEDGVQQEITFFSRTNLPIALSLLLDTSASMTANLDFLKSAAEQFLIRLLPEDRAKVGAFNDKIQFPGNFTGDRDELVASLRDLGFGNPTRLYDAVDASLDELREVSGRKVVVVFTDGEDTFSKNASAGRVLDRAREEEVMIYSIGLESVYFNGAHRVRTRPDRILRKLAEETGGGYFELKKTDELGPTFTRVAQELHSQYTLGFTPAVLDGREHKLTVRVKQPGMTARARRTYIASPERMSPTD